MNWMNKGLQVIFFTMQIEMYETLKLMHLLICGVNAYIKINKPNYIKLNYEKEWGGGGGFALQWDDTGSLDQIRYITGIYVL